MAMNLFTRMVAIAALCLVAQASLAADPWEKVNRPVFSFNN